MWISYATFDVILILTYIIRQYYALNALTERYADKPFKILGFPCNQFLRQVGEIGLHIKIFGSSKILCTAQEPGANASEIFAVLKHVRPGDDFVPNFEMFAKSDVSIDHSQHRVLSVHLGNIEHVI